MPPPKNFPPADQWNTVSFNPAWILRGVLAVIALWAFFSCFSTVPADSVGVITRFGKFTDIAKPGLVFKLPLGIDQLVPVPRERQLKLEFGFSTPGATNREQQSEDPEAEQSMVTGDLNMAMVEWVVQYRISDPKAFLFQVQDPAATLRDASEAVVREVVGDRTVDEVLTVGREEVETESLVRLKDLAERYGLGFSVIQVQLKSVHPPRQVQASFNEVNQAQQEKQQAINVANGEYNKAVPRARGMAEQKVSEAEGYAQKRVNEARGDAERFTAQLTEYLKAPEVTRQRLYLETISEVMPMLERKIILEPKATQLLPLIPLDLQSKSAVPAAPASLSR